MSAAMQMGHATNQANMPPGADPEFLEVGFKSRFQQFTRFFS